MINEELVPHLKSACVGIGIKVHGEQLPRGIYGSGFFVDPKGYLVTASHVITNLVHATATLNQKGIKTSFGAFWFKFLDDDTVQLQSKEICDKRTLGLKVNTEKYLGPDDVDIILCRIKGEYGSLPYLTFKKSEALKVYSEILICGYPGGSKTFSLSKEDHGCRTSPIVQTGRLSSLMPSDNTRQPVGIQTDIIAMGGSSGSPIVDANDGEVIGVVQRSIGADVKQVEKIGETDIGLSWGISNYLLNSLSDRTIQLMKSQEEIDGTVKKNLTKDDLNIKIHGHIKKGKFTDQDIQ